jgi:hypothetical protein
MPVSRPPVDDLGLEELRADAALLPAPLLPRPRAGVRVIDLTERELQIPAGAAAAVEGLADYGG